MPSWRDSGLLMETEDNPVEFPIDDRECSISENWPFSPADLRLLASTTMKCMMLEWLPNFVASYAKQLALLLPINPMACP